MHLPTLKRIKEMTLVGKPVASVPGLLKKILLLSLADGIFFPQRTVCISIARGSFSIACGTRSFGRIRIRGFRFYPVAGLFPTPDEVGRGAASFRETFRTHKYETVLSLPKDWAVAKTVDLPLAVQENLRNVISTEIDRLTPFEPGEAYFDYNLEAGSADTLPGRLHLLLAAVRSDQIAFYLKALESRNIRPRRLTLNFLNLGLLFTFREKGATAVFVDLEEAGYEAVLVVNGKAQAGYAGALPMHDGRLRMETVMKGVSVLKGLAPKDRMPEVVIHAGYSAESLLEMPDPPTTFPFRLIPEGDWGLKLERHGVKRPPPAAALGGVLPGSNPINLFRRDGRGKRRPPLILSLALLIVILSCSFFCLAGPLHLEQNRQEEIDKLIRQRKAEVSRIEERKKEMDALGRELIFLNSYHAPGPMVLDIIKELTGMLPGNAWLARMRITEGSVSVEGYTSGSAAEILAKLEKSGVFTRAEFASPIFRDQRMNAERFAIKMDLKAERTRIPHKPVGRNP